MDDNVTVDDIELAKLVLSDCGCSTEHTALLGRVSSRIGRHTESTRSRLSESEQREREAVALLQRAHRQIMAWAEQYGKHNPQWLPPAGDVRLLEDISEHVCRLAEQEKQG